jgi:uncharacterized membrane protein YkvA (DUF1232 family)
LGRGSRTVRDEQAGPRGTRDSRSGGDRIGLRRLLGWAAFLPLASRAPTYGRLIWALIRDERTPLARKALLAGALGYLLLGRDLVPDDLPLIGGLDDLIVIVLAVDLFIDGIPPAVLDEKLVELGIDRRAFADDIAHIRRFMPRPVRRLLRRIPGMIGFVGDTLAHSGLGPRVRAFINKEGSIA